LFVEVGNFRGGDDAFVCVNVVSSINAAKIFKILNGAPVVGSGPCVQRSCPLVQGPLANSVRVTTSSEHA
jgi:hypothetical protein